VCGWLEKHKKSFFSSFSSLFRIFSVRFSWPIPRRSGNVSGLSAFLDLYFAPRSHSLRRERCSWMHKGKIGHACAYLESAGLGGERVVKGITRAV